METGLVVVKIKFIKKFVIFPRMSKRGRSCASADEDASMEEPAAKRLCVVESGETLAASREAEMTLLWLVETSGLNKEFFDLLDPLSQRALCCINAACRQHLKDMRAPLPVCLPRFYDPPTSNYAFDLFCGRAARHNYWRGQLGLVLHYDYVARIDDIIARDMYHYEMLNWAIMVNATACALRLALTLPPEHAGLVQFEDASVLMIRILTMVRTIPLDNIARHILLHAAWPALISLIEDPPPGFDLCEFLVMMRKILLRIRIVSFQRDLILMALKPYGKRVAEHNPRPLLAQLKDWTHPPGE